MSIEEITAVLNEGDTNKLKRMISKLLDEDTFSEENYSLIDYEYYGEREWIELFDILEYKYDSLLGVEKLEFQRAINVIFKESMFPWRLIDGHIIGIDSSYVQREIIPLSLEKMKIEGFDEAIKEFNKAQHALITKKYKLAIHYACKSFESNLKVVLGEQKGTAKQLIDKLTEKGFFYDFPADADQSFGDNVFTALDFIRNRIAGHAQGDNVEIGEEYAKLAINLAAVYHAFFMDKYQACRTSYTQESDSDIEDYIPF